MANQTILCPYCKKEIPLTEAISHRIREELRKEFEMEAQKREQDYLIKEQALLEREKRLEEETSQKIKREIEKIEKEALQKAEQSVAIELEDLRAQVLEREQKLQEAQTVELELRRQRRELEDRQKNLNLEMARKIDEERERIREETARAIEEEHRLKELEKEKQIKDMLKQIEELKRKAEQGSQQLQGEVLELDLEEALRVNFPVDQIEPVAKGKRGADLLHRVCNQHGHLCGTIIWESKRTKGWSEGWIEKLKDDQRDAKAEIAVLVTTVLPKDVNHFQIINGVWVTHPALAVCLAMALRTNLIQVANARISAIGKNEKMEALYSYLSGPEFTQRIEAIVGSFIIMKNDLDQEKRAMSKIWAKREKQIERVIINLSGMYGEMQGIVGTSLGQIKSLELKTMDENGSLNESDLEKEDFKF